MIDSPKNEKESESENELKTLISEKERLTTEGKYLEADTFKAQIAKYKERTMSQKVITLKEYQLNEKQELEEQYESELKALTDFWDEKITAYQHNTTALEEESKNQREKNIESLINLLTTSYKPMKYSKEYLECKTMELNMAKNEKFKEAHYYKLKCEKMEQDIIERYSKSKDDYIQNQVESYELKLDSDKRNLQEKCKVNLSLLMIQKEKDVTKLNKKFKNRRNELNNIHLMQNKISQNENHLRAKVTANRISSLMRNTTSKTSKSNKRKGNTMGYTNNNTQQSEGNTIKLPVMDNNDEYTLTFLEKEKKNNQYSKNIDPKGKESPGDSDGYLNQYIDFDNSSNKEKH